MSETVISFTTIEFPNEEMMEKHMIYIMRK